MQKLSYFFKKTDLFGVPIQLLNAEKEKGHTSIFGGLISCSITAASLFYFIYVIIEWNYNEILPTISAVPKVTAYEEFSWQSSIIEFELQDYNSDVNPFSENNNIITPLLFIVEDNQVKQDPQPLFSSLNNKTRSITINNGTLVLNNLNTGSGEYKIMQSLVLVFTICKAEFMTENSSCADDETIFNYMSNYHGLLYLKIILNQLDHVTKTLKNFEKHYYTAFLPQLNSYSQVLMKSQQSTVDDGILFRNINKHTFLNDYELINQQVDSNFIQNIVNEMSNGKYQIQGFSTYLFRIDNISIKEEIVMPKLGQVLAEIGSIVQILFFLKYLALFYNQTSLENSLYHDIITMYYPEFKKICSFNYFGNKLRITEKGLIEKYKKLQLQAQEKCRLNNILYEISRIQFILESQFGQQALILSHELGGNIDKNKVDENENLRDSGRMAVKPVDSLDIQQSKSEFAEPLEILIKQS